MSLIALQTLEDQLRSAQAELREQVRINTELQKAIGKEHDQQERMRRALMVLNARFHSVCNGIGPHVSALYLEDLAEVHAILGEKRDPQSGS